MDVDRHSAATYAGWFKALADPTRILILNLLARSERALSVAEIVAAVDVSQPTVSHHLRVLAEVGFVLVERHGTTTRVRVNERCVGAFPSAADVVMGRLPRYLPEDQRCCPPWLEGVGAHDERSTT